MNSDRLEMNSDQRKEIQFLYHHKILNYQF